MITSPYGYGDQVIGSLGVVGPVRMEYARTIGIVNHVARVLEQMLADSFRQASPIESRTRNGHARPPVR